MFSFTSYLRPFNSLRVLGFKTRLKSCKKEINFCNFCVTYFMNCTISLELT